MTLTFADIVGDIIELVLRPLVLIIFTLALIYFIWGIAKYILHGDNAEKRQEGYRMMIWGIIALAVMVSVWSIVFILTNTFGVEFPVTIFTIFS